MTHRRSNPEPLITSTVIENNGASWNEETKELARKDAQRVLEAMVAEFGVEEAVRALDNQGFKGDAYRYFLNLVYEEAMHRRQRAERSSAGTLEGGR